MGLFKKKKKEEFIIVNHGRGDIRKYPSAGSQLGVNLQNESAKDKIKTVKEDVWKKNE